MADSPASETPSTAPVCPLCGGPNGCAASASGSFETPCWCREVVFPAAVLDRLSDDQRGQACVCRDCLEAANRDAV